eukprot:TRINITY_DN21707_c0_g1_i2.p1 TRINITY_DN21707_c0_g1~~TRINITY_DN21707_c0_g1_i2.p1  ORF type:complete len:271 (+),score=112.21 TRINITY_DN21707_c0_g1_i2:222-1034(+)
MVGMQVGGLPMTGIQGRKKTLGEEFIEKEKEKLQKFAASCQREGRPLSMMDMWNRERDILERARGNADRMEEMLAMQRKETEDAKKVEAEAAAQRSLLRASGGGSKSLRRTIDSSFDGNDDEAAAEDIAAQNAELERTFQEGSTTNDDVTTQSPSLKKSRIEWDDTNEITTTASPAAVAAPAAPTTATTTSNDESSQKRTQVLAALKACIAAAHSKDMALAAELLEATHGDVEGQTMVDVKAMQRKVEATISDIMDDEPEFDFAALRAVL